MNNFCITMSGGTTPVINATLSGCINSIQQLYPSSIIYVPVNGINGILKNEFKVIKPNISHKLLKDLKYLPGSSIIGTSRIHLISDEDIDNIEQILVNKNINTWINIGGSGTIKQSKVLSLKLKNIRLIALPKTIDNDFGDIDFKLLYYTPGYITTMNYMINHAYNLLRENDGASSHDTVLISQTFGRDTGFIAALISLIKLNDSVDCYEKFMILFPEKIKTKSDILSEIKRRIKLYGGCIIIIVEGYSEFIDFDKQYDKSKQIKFGSSSSTACQELVNFLHENDIECRLCNTTIEQRHATAHLSKYDINTAYDIGKVAIECIKFTDGSFFIGIDSELELIKIPLIDIPTDFSRRMPEHFINEYDTSDEYIEYMKPLYYYGRSLIKGTDYLNKKNFIENA